MPCHRRGDTANQRPYSNNITMSKFPEIALRMMITQHCFKIRLSLLENVCNTKRGSNNYTSFNGSHSVSMQYLSIIAVLVSSERY